VRRLAAVILALLAGGCAGVERLALPERELLDPRWSRTAAEPTVVVNHEPWDGFLATYLETDAAGVNRLDYAEVTTADRAVLDGYLRDLEALDPAALTRDQQLAYWINLYNAATVAVVLDAYPVGSIREITDGPLSFGPWDRPLVEVEGVSLTLNDIEHRIIRPVFDEPRIHYALNCAAVGCPNLRHEAWRAEGLDAALADAEQAYVNDVRGVRVEFGGRLTLSKIYIWFREDFGADEAAVLASLAEVAEPFRREVLRDRTTVDDYAYDWALNDQATAP